MSKIIKVDFTRKWQPHLDELIQSHLAQGTFPGVEILFASQGEILLHQAWGNREIGENNSSLQINTLWDIASITKPLATATSILILQERGELNLADKVSQWVPEYGDEARGAITLKHLLTHTSGLSAWENLYENVRNKDEAWARLLSFMPQQPLQHTTIYSCLGYLILAEIVRRVSKQSLAQFVKENILEPLEMKSSGFSPWQQSLGLTIAPTQYCPFRKKLLRGVVHDENAYVFDEEGGNAGLFSTALDLFRFCEMLFGNGEWQRARILSPQSLQNSVRNHNPKGLAARGLGWDYHTGGWGYMSCGELFPIGGIGHTGFTGTSIWIDLVSKTAIIVLSNRVHLSREKNQPQMMQFRPRLHNVLMSSLETRGS